MKADRSKRTLIAVAVVALVAIAFWMLLLSPKMKEKDELSTQVEQQQVSLTQTQSALSAAENAKRQFPKNYRQLVTLGKAVPESDETASLLVQLNTVANRSGSKLQSMELGAEGSPEESAGSTTEGETTGASPTEAEASLLPLGATVGPAGFAVMPYELLFTGSFFGIANFMKGIDSMVQTENPGLTVDGRLVTINSFSMSEAGEGFPKVNANISVTTYVAPPGQGLTGSSELASPAEGEAEASGEESTETAEGTPSADVSEEAK
jgi:Tfp pilus assembly protein PilO